MSLTNRNKAALVFVLLSGIALWGLPDQVRGQNELFGMNGALLPALALALICGFSLLDLALSLLVSRRSGTNRETLRANDILLSAGFVYGLLLVALSAALFTLLLPWIGYLPASCALVLTLMFGLGGRKPIAILVISFVAVAVLYLGMRFGLGIHMQAWPINIFRAN